MRGRLINPFKLKLFQLDVVATAADPDAGGPETSGYDSVFREPVRLTDGSSAREEKAPILLPVQVEPTTYEQLTQQASGNDPTSNFGFVFHFLDLERLGLVDALGNASLRIGDRAESIHRHLDESLIMKLGLKGGGLYCTEVQPRGFGLVGGERNLLLCTFANREKTYRGG